MTDVGKKAPGLWARFVRWIKDHMVGEVPAEAAVCEFDCRQPQCLYADSISCERRITRAAQELISDFLQEWKKNRDLTFFGERPRQAAGNYQGAHGGEREAEEEAKKD